MKCLKVIHGILIDLRLAFSCKSCGRVPLRLIEDGVNDVRNGSLRVDIRKDDKPCGTGVCGQPRSQVGKPLIC